MDFHYSKEKNVQIILSLLKQYGIKKVIASPGSTNISMVASMQQDPWFEMYSSVDERSAAYIACGMAAESGEAVVLTCTAATASRNYVPGLTEAYYRKLPILAITSTTPLPNIGHHQRQSMDRSSVQKDIANLSVLVRIVHDGLSEWDCNIQVNKALSELSHRGGGPVHINLETEYSMDFGVKELPVARKITRIEHSDLVNCPQINHNRVGVFIGSCDNMNSGLVTSIERFCESHNAVVFVDHTSHYNGKYAVHYALLGMQEFYRSSMTNLDLLIHIGNVSGDDYTTGALSSAKEVWRVSRDGEMVDTFKKLKYVFEMDEVDFFHAYESDNVDTSFSAICHEEYSKAIAMIPDLPLSNLWIAKELHASLPRESRIYMGILNSLRSWNIFETDSSIRLYSNVGGFGIDGGLSSLVGAALCYPERIYYGIFGDLQFFYDMNVIGNRHFPANVRIILINNGRGTEFRNYKHPATIFGEETDRYIAAAGHYGKKSENLIKHYSEDLGLDYFCIKYKQEFSSVRDRFVNPIVSKPMLMEVFTNTEEESEALKLVRGFMVDSKDMAIRKTKDALKKILPSSTIESIRNMLK